MKRVIGIGETVLDILFKNDQPRQAVPGGSTFNSIVSLGRIDYWCIYEGYSFVIELKQSYDNIRAGHTKKDKLTERWHEMIKQLDSVKKEIQGFDEKTKGVIRLGLHIITSWNKEDNVNDHKDSFDRKTIEKIAVRLRTDISKTTPRRKPDIIICWKIPQSIVEQGVKWGLVYPGLWAVVKTYAPIRHKGMKR